MSCLSLGDGRWSCWRCGGYRPNNGSVAGSSTVSESSLSDSDIVMTGGGRGTGEVTVEVVARAVEGVGSGEVTVEVVARAVRGVGSGEVQGGGKNDSNLDCLTLVLCLWMTRASISFKIQ